MGEPETTDDPSPPTYPLRTVTRLTGLSPEVLRAWERRYGVVAPVRTPGGTRRYSADDLERLRLVKAAVDAGHRIGRVARMEPAELRRIGSAPGAAAGARLGEVLRALDALDGAESQRLLGIQLSALGPARFAREFACPLVHEIGARWEDDRMGIASEHLASGVLRSLLGAALQPTPAALLGPRILFATPGGERHELGLLMAALTAMGSGAHAVYLGPDVPVDDLLGAVDCAGAAVLAIGLVSLPTADAERVLRALRAGLPSDVGLWVGGAGALRAELPAGVERLESLEQLERRVALLAAAPDTRG